MFTEMKPRFLLQLIVVVAVGIHSCLCDDDMNLYQSCRQLFECGNLTREIGYPFWGGPRPPSCGHPSFHLSCKTNIPLINISSLSYRVLAIDASTKTLRVSRVDLWDDVCSTLLFNATFNSTPFHFDSTARLITLYYNCNSTQPIPNQFNCSRIGNSFQLRPENGTDCRSHISIPVNQTGVQALTLAPTASTLQSVVRDGFLIQWSADNQNCKKCVKSGGVCGYNQSAASFACYCANNGTSNSTCSTASASGKGHAHWPMYVIIGVSLVAAALIFYATRNCRFHILLDQTNSPNTDEFLMNSCGSLVPKRYSYNEIKKITKTFSHKLGQGGNGTVFQGNLPDGHLVAVKVLSTMSGKGEEFMNEVVSISTTSHVNIVNLLGFCYDGNIKALVYEFMPNGSLDKFLYKTTGVDCQLPLEILYQIAVGVARGLEYLHRGCNTRIVHFDIKPHNILLDNDFCPKIADFGLAKLCKGKQGMVSILDTRGTIGYIAPEVFSRDFGPVSHKSDVYSYGMMLLEMAGAKKFDEIEAAQSSENYFPGQIYDHVVLNSDKLDVITEENAEFARKLLLVGLWCIQVAPSNRPSMTKVVEMLEGTIQSIQIPPKSFLYPSNLLVPQFISTFSIDACVDFENSIDH